MKGLFGVKKWHCLFKSAACVIWCMISMSANASIDMTVDQLNQKHGLVDNTSIPSDEVKSFMNYLMT